MTNFDAIAMDNTASCLEIRPIGTQRNSELASLNDQEYEANLPIGDLCKEAWI